MQGDYALRKTGNYLDLVEGDGYHLQPLTFHAFLSKSESLFMYDDSFMQIPGYIQEASKITLIEEPARKYVVDYIMDEFEHNLLGMQDYVRWATLFEHKCASLTPAFWAQVNMHDLMMAYELEMDDNSITRTNTGNATRLGGQTTKTDQTGKSKTVGKSSTKQDIDNKQTSDTSSREGTATVVRAESQLTDDLQYNWSDAADNIHEVRSRPGDSNQHMESNVESESATESESHSEAVVSLNNSKDETKNTAKEESQLTNKMFMQEKQWAINTARELFPLEWLRLQLRPLFYMIY